MKQPLFHASQFTPTQWDTAEQKAKFANHLVRFIESGYKKSLFYDWFYKRLSTTFGHIAHYNRLTFYSRFFEGGVTERVEFGHSLLTGGGYGDPAWTYSDVERMMQVWAHKRNAEKGW